MLDCQPWQMHQRSITVQRNEYDFSCNVTRQRQAWLMVQRYCSCLSYGERGALTMTYTLTAHPDIIVRDEDGAFIPTDPDNTDYAQIYLAWLDEGNEPTPYTPPPGPRQRGNPVVESLTQNYDGQSPKSPSRPRPGAGFSTTISTRSMRWCSPTSKASCRSARFTMFGGAAAPANWLLCQGQTLSTTEPMRRCSPSLATRTAAGAAASICRI